MTNLAQQTLASIVISNHLAVPVFEKYDLDFCCRGKRTLTAVCEERNIPLTAITEELKSVMAPQDNRQMPFDQMSAEQLISHILIRHHFYTKQSMPQIYEHLNKVATKHGDKFPYMKKVFGLFAELKTEMIGHMEAEEKILFPRIKEIENSRVKNHGVSALVETLEKMVGTMETEHDHAGQIMFKIRSLTNNYTIPEGACTTFQITLAELKEFEEDLHQHVHLENNILFSNAVLQDSLDA